MAVDDTAKNRSQQVKGKAKEQVGKATGNKKLERSGQADMAKGEVKQRGSKIKDAFS
ncbi:CsbD family protein [Actinomycetospora sp. OC33-EN08]|uniref:CsbD family protein n=1 Tax=Actinomycetospora aurantiaca TaxID=3129233 RepID=A0ABU8MWU6_9PSEU